MRANHIALCLSLSALVLAAMDRDGWGWFLVGAVLIVDYEW